MATYDHSTSAAARAATLAQRCQRPQQRPDGAWSACCPAHEDRSPSLSITATDDRVLLHCHAGCEARAVVAALGLEMADLFVEAPSPSPRPHRPRPAANGPPRVVATYEYHDADGQIIYRVLRREPGRQGRAKDFQQQRPDGHGGWLHNLDGVTRVLFRLPAVLQAIHAGQTVYLCEGEKNALDVLATGLVATTAPGGAGKWHSAYTEALRGADVVLLEDDDAPGQKHTRLVAPQLHGVAARVRVLRLPGLPPKGDVSDWLAAGGTRAQLEALVAQTPLWTPSLAPEAAESDDKAAADERPVIPITPHLPAMIDTLQEVLRTQEPPRLYVHADRLCVLRRHQGGQAPGAPPEVGGLYLADLTRPHLTELASGLARWEAYDRRVKAWRHTLPSQLALDGFLARGQWPFHELSGVITAPTLRPDGSVLDQPGYDVATGLYYDPQGVTFPPLPCHPTLDDARTALGQLADVFGDFLYPNPAYGSTVLAAVLSLVCRHAIAGNVPLFGVTATTRASGKGLLVDAIALIGTGRRAPKWTQTRDEEEERKQLLAVALEGDPVICIDNCAYPLGSPGLDLVLTAGVAKGRVLGKTQTTTVALHAVFFATGNNLQYRGDLARRVVPIHLDPQMERPEERDGFRHPQLLQWVAQERPRLLAAALTLLQAYVVAGCPAQGLTPYGSFEAWSDTVRSALVWVGEPDPCEGRQGLEASSDDAYDVLAELLDAWHACYGEKPQTLKTVFRQLDIFAHESDYQRLQEALEGFCDTGKQEKKISPRVVGNLLKKVEKRIINHKRFENKGDSGRDGKKWGITSL